MIQGLSAGSSALTSWGGDGSMELCTQPSRGSQEASILTQPVTLDNSLSPLNLSLVICRMGFWSFWI